MTWNVDTREPRSIETDAAADNLPSSGRRWMSAIVFVDLTGFTGLSEDVGLDATHKLLTQFHEIVRCAAEASDGRVSARSGDGAMMFFHGGVDPTQDAVRALLACASLIRQMETWIAGFSHSRPPDGFRVAAHFGEVLIAQLSCRDNSRSTPLGDVVNVAHRLLEVAKEKGADLALSGDLIHAAAPLMPNLLEGLGRREYVAIRGRKQGVCVYTALAPALLPAAELRNPSNLQDVSHVVRRDKSWASA